MRLSHRGLSPYELSAALRHVLESYKSQRPHPNKQPAFSAGAAKNARQASPVAATKGDPTAAASPGEAEEDAIPSAVLLPGETEGNAQGGPTAGPGRVLTGGRDSTQGRTVVFAENERGPEGTGVSAVGGVSAAEAEEAPAQAHGRVIGAVPAAVTSSTERAEKGTAGGAGGGAKQDLTSRSAFADQDWRALEPDLTQFCHKVPHV